MLTAAKRTANRANAGASTGPRTARGKTASSANALTHGLRSRRVLVPGESRAEFDAFCTALRADLAPEGALEDALVDRLTGLLWRLRRVPWLEAGVLRAHVFDHRRQRRLQHCLTAAPPVSPAERAVLDAARRRAHAAANELGRAFEQVVRQSDALTKLTRYETTIDRALHRALRDLTAVQWHRRASPERRAGGPGCPAP